jgi:hypothetical protein
MSARLPARQWWTALVLSAFATCALAQSTAAPSKEDFHPDVGQQGKDVVWVPTPQELVDKMLDLAKLTPRDFLMDLGSGDGRTVITAAKRGARAIGIEYNPDMVNLSKRNAETAGVSDRASFQQADLFKTDLSKASVITMFLLTDINLKLRPTILSLKPGTRIVSNTFRMGDWEPDQTAEVGCNAWCTAHLWIVPARVEGKWKTPQGELALRQKYQTFSGTLNTDGRAVPVSGKLNGDEISFKAEGAEYRGRVSDRTIEGAVKSPGKSETWKATR